MKETNLPNDGFTSEQFFEAAKEKQMSKLLLGLDDTALVKTERMLYTCCEKTQKTLLFELLNANKDTEFGKAHNFDKIKTIEDYRREVPLSEWSDYKPYAERLGKGEEDILFPGKATFFYRTSGTTSAYKFIPESEREALVRKAIVRVRRTEMFLMGGQRMPRHAFSLFNRAGVDYSEGGIPRGSASGRTGDLTDPAQLKMLTCPPQLVNEFEGDELTYMLLRTSLRYDDIEVITGNNALMMYRVIKYGQEHARELISDIRTGGCKYEMSDNLKTLLADNLAADPTRADELEKLLNEDHFTPRYYWPNLIAAAFWLGGSVGVYVDRIRPLLPEKTLYIDDGYGSSETKINVPLKPNTPAGALATFSSFFEFIPESGGEPLLAHELEDGKNYEIVLTTNAGLYRYRIKDLIHVDGFTGTTPNIYFVTKLADVANVAQEKIPGSMLLEAITATADEAGSPCVMAQVYPDSSSTSYVICMEMKEIPADKKVFEQYMDEGLRKRVDVYEMFRGELELLASCRLVFMKKGWSDHMMKKYAKGNATMGQVKVPVVIDAMPEAEWIAE